MKAVEFETKIIKDTIELPKDVSLLLNEGREIKVIILFDEKEKLEENDFKTLTREQFLDGYSDSDSVYDNY